jgi:two-component system chemotaxis response regulator CheY
VVDDSATFRQLLCMSLTRLDGISQGDITEAVDGQDALGKVRDNNFDLVLTDIRMPNMDGLEFVNKVRTELKRDLPIIIISTKGADEDIEKGMSLGATGYLSKPISMTKLRELVTGCLSEQA